MFMNDLSNSKVVFFRYCKKLEENYNINFFDFIENNGGIYKSQSKVESSLRVLRESSNFRGDYMKNIMLLSTIKKMIEIGEVM